MGTKIQTVFVVDDDDHVRSSLVRSLSLRGFSVESYASARDFLDAFDKSAHGCLILDQGMPNMTGLELQEKLVENQCRIPIIFLTGHGGASHSAQAMRLGAFDFLEKPVPQAVLVERIQAALKGRSSPAK